MIRVSILLTVHNRKEKTLVCLKHIYNQTLPAYIQVSIYMTDDGSTDETADEVRKLFPSVTIVPGDGNLFWNRGMYKAWEKASQTNDYDFYLWLNDDTRLYTDTIAQIITVSKSIEHDALICGATRAADKSGTTYGGRRIGDSSPITPNDQLQECDIINGNFVLIPKAIFKKTGNLDWRFRHAIGDFDYGLRVKKAGFRCYVAPKHVGTCEPNPALPKWCLPSTPLIERFKLLYSPLGYAEPVPFFIYEKRHFGFAVAFKHLVSIHLRALLPQLWK